jgi:cytochrome b6-f complex iron-sulfur subunit
MRRRSFFNALLGFSVISMIGGTIYSIFKYLWPTHEVLGKGKEKGVTVVLLEEIPVNGYKVVRHLGKPHIVVRLSDEIHALNAVCTHLGCIVYYDKDINQLACPCHAAFFDLNGNVISGPPPRPLPKATVQVKGNNIVIA